MNTLKIRSASMMSPCAQGNAGSWAVTIHHLAREFIKTRNQIYLSTTNGILDTPKDLLKYFRECIEPDIDYTYCTPNNWCSRFSGILAGTKRAKLRIGIINYESSILPSDWITYHKYVDYILVSSLYCEDIFLKAGAPREKIIVMPLGIDFESLNSLTDPGFVLNTNKKFKLLNVSIAHARKNIPLLIDSYFKEFSATDDICLIIKTSLMAKKVQFEVDVNAAVNEIRQKYIGKSLPELILLDCKFNNMSTIYNSVDALINVAASEGFGLPLLEAMVCNKLVCAPRYGGVLDFLEHNKNSLLIDTKEVIADSSMQYWQAQPNAVIGLPSQESIMFTMRNLYENHELLHRKLDDNMNKTVQRYTWANSAKIIIDLYNGKKPEKKIGELL